MVALYISSRRGEVVIHMKSYLYKPYSRSLYGNPSSHTRNWWTSRFSTLTFPCTRKRLINVTIMEDAEEFVTVVSLASGRVSPPLLATTVTRLQGHFFFNANAPKRCYCVKERHGSRHGTRLPLHLPFWAIVTIKSEREKVKLVKSEKGRTGTNNPSPAARLNKLIIVLLVGPSHSNKRNKKALTGVTPGATADHDGYFCQGKRSCLFSFHFRTQHHNYHHRYRSLLTFYPNPNSRVACVLPSSCSPRPHALHVRTLTPRLPALRRAHHADRGTARACSQTRLSARGRL